LSGIAESVGIVIAMLLYTGPVAVTPLPGWVYLTGLGLAAAHVWSAWSQVMTDASWYNPGPEPSRFLLGFRPLMPLSVAVIAFTLDGWREITGQGSPPGGLATALLLAGSVLLLLPYALLFELILRSALQTCDVQMSAVRVADASTVHSVVKNAAHALARRVLQDLVTNSWKADAANIRVEVRGSREHSGWVSVRVADDGSGITAGELSDPRSSLHVLEDYLRHFGGMMTLAAGSDGGTLAVARWRASRW
jgi:hypothetical protein